MEDDARTITDKNVRLVACVRYKFGVVFLLECWDGGEPARVPFSLN